MCPNIVLQGQHMHDPPIHPHVAIIIIIIILRKAQEVKFPLSTPWGHIGRGEITALSILYCGARSKNQSWYPLNRRPGGPTTGLGVLKRKISFPYRDPNPGPSNRSLVSILTMLPGLPLYHIIIIIIIIIIIVIITFCNIHKGIYNYIKLNLKQTVFLDT